MFFVMETLAFDTRHFLPILETSHARNLVGLLSHVNTVYSPRSALDRLSKAITSSTHLKAKFSQVILWIGRDMTDVTFLT